ncbi:hypothetical protein VF14_09030 [Nostoc linckia z18]|uniref:Uncharacterized protein n=2 Tax=Nostoc linckia TaxID=92942 RepID=A0A9Q6EM87_NOSLI|nr:hypothetical protein [Nostoc linckia]PHK32495.1 hypothetical protein VF12_26600 [Nostoc linckia z15]PHK44559.1 hypothetical protein VF13_21380 [Nostoc linckia z16]PHJ59603.1 hypothetical protein VF02_24655 [Nostoc linckia z1]PHJ65119.1 hypothetical protein VF05_21495 [Nostoc linckia z3]PHJ69608.1 hypothetical protein VF03_23735 [Nostoc linckia z2]
MRYAKSLLYGVIVNASECGYRNYANWQLRCPKCGEPVYLIAASKRQEHARLAPKSKQIVLVRSAEVSPSFAHFKGLADESCENFNHQINQSYINRFNAINRQQRLKIYNSRFLEIVGYDKHEMRGCFFSAFKLANNLDNKTTKKIEKEVAESFWGIASDLKTFQSGARMLLENLKGAGNPLVHFDTSRADESTKQNFLHWINRIDIEMQMTLVSEAIDFLKTRAAKAIALEIFELAFFRMIYRKDNLKLLKIGKPTIEEESKQYSKMIGLCIVDLVEIFALTDWAGAMSDGETYPI